MPICQTRGALYKALTACWWCAYCRDPGSEYPGRENEQKERSVMKKLLPLAIIALMIPSVALAKGKPPTAGTHTNHGKANVMYLLRGMVCAYTAYDSATQ